MIWISKSCPCTEITRAGTEVKHKSNLKLQTKAEFTKFYPFIGFYRSYKEQLEKIMNCVLQPMRLPLI